MSFIETLNWADYAIIVIIGFSVVIGAFRGFVREGLSLTTWVVACWVGIIFADVLATNFLAAYITNGTLSFIVAFFILFAITLIIGTLFSNLLCQIIQKTGLKGTDRVLGLIFGAARGILIVAILLLAGGLTQMPTEGWWKKSILIEQVHPVAVWIQELFPNHLNKKSSE